MHCEIKLCRVKNREHEDKLLEVAKWLDDNKFSCTFSILNEIAYFDIESDSHWDQDGFVEGATKEVLSALADNLS
jgi:hypothetical protein